MPKDNRLARRIRLGRRCWVVMGPQQEPIECRISDISESGAKLEGHLNVELPQLLELLLTENGNVRRSCTVVWQVKNELGVRFLRRERRARAA